jgi:hypothetical protein
VPVLVAMALVPCRLVAQEVTPTDPSSRDGAPAPNKEDGDQQIIVIGQRAIVAVLENVEPEDTYDEDRIASYAVSTVGELLDEVRSENGDDQPTILINGQPVRDLGDVSDLPVEAVRRVEQLPRGSAQRVGGAPSQRAYNVVLLQSLKSATTTVSRLEATEGGTGQTKGEQLLTYIQGQDRLNLTVRGSRTDVLLESDRGIVPRPETFPFSGLGNILPAGGATQVDAQLSAIAGQTVTVIGLDGTAQQSLSGLLAGANLPNRSDAPRFRSLRPGARPWEVALAGNKQLADWLSLSFNARLSGSEAESFRGLPSGRFLIPASNPSTPLGSAVFLALSDTSRALTTVSKTDSGLLSATLSATLGEWHANLLARYESRGSRVVSQVNGSFAGGFFTVPASTNPFDGTLAALIPVTERVSLSDNEERQVSGDAEGPLFTLPAGAVLGRVGLNALWTRFSAEDVFGGPRSFSRSQWTATGGLTIPVSGPGFLGGLGQSDLALDLGRLDLAKYGTIDRYILAFNWSPVAWLRLTATQSEDGTAIYGDLAAAPVVVTDNVPYFDPLRNETVDVRLVTGGTGQLANPQQRVRGLSLAVSPLEAYRLLFNIDYQETSQRNLIGALPPPSSAVVSAFSDRFVRDPSGRLIQVDNSSVNFERQDTNQVRFGVSFIVPIAKTISIPRTKDTPSRRIPPVNLQVNMSHTLVLDSTTVIRSGLPEIDLLTGGAIGVGGGGQRNSSSASLALNRRKSGLRLNATYRGRTYLKTGTIALPDRLTFGELFQLDLRAFVDLGEHMRGNRFAKNTRISLLFDNVFNDRQRIRDSKGTTPQAYQPIYRDPIGRTVQLEVRKVF